MKRAFRIYREFIKISFSSAAAYRTDFFFTLIITFFSNMLSPLITVLIYAAGVEIPGWTYHEALLVQSVFMLCSGICTPFFSNMVWVTMEHIQAGTYDLLMLKPGSTIFITLVHGFDLSGISIFIGGLLMFVYSVSNVPAAGAAGWLSFLFLFVMGICMILGCILLMTASAFKWVGNGRIFEIYDAVTLFGRYPGSIYSRVLSGVLTYVIPVSMLGFFPASAILGRATREMFLAAIPCILFVVLGWYVFRKMIYLYQSAGG